MPIEEIVANAGYTIIKDNILKVEIVAKDEKRAIRDFKEFLHRNGYHSSFGVIVKHP